MYMAFGTASPNMTLLWENPARSNEFAAQSVSFDASKYDAFLVLFFMQSGYTLYSAVALKGENTALPFTYVDPNYAFLHGTRRVTIRDTGATFENNYISVRMATGAEGTAWERNDMGQPYRIYGLK